MELTYTKHGDYYLPDLDIPAQEKVPINRYGRMHGDYLKKNNRTVYNELLFSGRLNRYLVELGEQAEKMLALLMEQYAAAENVTEEMKTADQMGWVRAMNSIRNRAGIYLEDLFVKPEYRGKGYGKGLIQTLAKIAVERGCGRLEWWCLDWNKPSIDFCISLGAEPMEDWTVYRIAGEKLTDLADT